MITITSDTLGSISQILIPDTAPWQPFAVALGTIAFYLMIPVAIISRIRTKLGKRGNTFFRRSHLIAYGAWPCVTAHYIFAGTDAMAEWSIVLIIAAGAALIFLMLARGFVPPTTRERPANTANPTSAPQSTKLGEAQTPPDRVGALT